jgi:hypothetical protein
MLVLIEAADTNWEVVWQSEKRNMTFYWSWVFIWDHCLLFFVGSKLKCSLDRGCREWNLKIWSWISLVLISFLDCKARRSRQLHLSGQGPAANVSSLIWIWRVSISIVYQSSLVFFP